MKSQSFDPSADREEELAFEAPRRPMGRRQARSGRRPARRPPFRPPLPRRGRGWYPGRGGAILDLTINDPDAGNVCCPCPQPAEPEEIEELAEGPATLSGLTGPPGSFQPVPVESPGGGRIKNKRDPNPADLVKVPQSGGGSVPLHWLAAQALDAMIRAARADGIAAPLLLPVSGYRSTARQAGLWKKALAKAGGNPQEARKWVAPPGHSAHHSGRAVDLNLGYGISSKHVAAMQTTAAWRWLTQNAVRFGFYPYPREPWHWEYNPPSRPGRPVTPAPRTGPAPGRGGGAKPPKAAASDQEAEAAIRIAERQVPGMPGTTLKDLIEQWRQPICPEIPRSILIAFIKRESGGKFTKEMHGTKDNGWTSPAFYELGIFQTPAGLHGRCTSAEWNSCEFKPPPGREGTNPSSWSRLCNKIGANPKQWTNPTTQVRVGLHDLEDGANELRKGFSELFPKPGSDWDIRMAVLYRFARGGGYARSFLRAFRRQLADMPEEQRWAFLRGKSVTVQVTKAGRRVKVTRTFKGENVEKKMALASKLGYTPIAPLHPLPVQQEASPVKGATSPVVSEERTPAALTQIVKVPLRAASTPEWRQWSAVYFPPAVDRNSRTIDVILYLHGHRTGIPGAQKSIWAYLKHKCWPLREHLATSGKAAVLIAPTLGPKSQAGSLLERGGLDRYLDAALAATATFWSSGAAPAVRSIILAGHSGAGFPMRVLARSGNRYAALIKEVWGFDSTYSAKGNADSTGWAAWAQTHPQSRLFIYFLRGAPTQNQAEKLRKRALPNVTVIESNAKKRDGIHPHFWVPIQHWGERITASPHLRR